MSNKANSISRQRSTSLKERIFANRERKTSKSLRARLSSADSAPSEALSTLPSTKYSLIKEINLRIHEINKNVPRNLSEKRKGSSRLPWKWDSYSLVFGDEAIYSNQPCGVFAEPLPYTSIESCSPVNIPELPFHYIKVCTTDTSFLIQLPDVYQRDRLLHSIPWKKSMYKYKKILYSATRPEVIVRELQNLVRLTMDGPFHADDTHHTLVDIVSNLIQNHGMVKTVSHDTLITTLAPLFKENQPSIEICNFFTKYCRDRPRSRVVIEIFTPIVQRILKYNMNFAKTIWLGTFVKQYIQALDLHNDGDAAVRTFLQTAHGPLSICPHKRMLNNLIAICLSAIYESFAEKDENTCEKSRKSLKNGKEQAEDKERDSKMNTEKREPDMETALLFVRVLNEISKISDWLPGLAVLLQSIPFHPDAMSSKCFVRYLVQIIERMTDDGREEVLWCLLNLREQKECWIQLFNPNSPVCQDDGSLFIKMTTVLLRSARVCSKTKKLVSVLLRACLDAVMLLALRECEVMIEVLCYMLEYELVVGQQALQIISTLRTSPTGKKRYNQLCEQETVMMQKGGPDGYTLPPRSTDQDLHTFLSNGSCGNLRNLNLSFTAVSCESADIISRLPSLQHLNLWSTHIQDIGLRRLCETLNLKTLNLCETRVTDEGIICLKDMTNLTSLNLNSTLVTDIVYQELKNSLPNLDHCDITYTEAWRPEKPEPLPNNASTKRNEAQAQTKKLVYKHNV